jgi:segregation and condensation protein B
MTPDRTELAPGDSHDDVTSADAREERAARNRDVGDGESAGDDVVEGAAVATSGATSGAAAYDESERLPDLSRDAGSIDEAEAAAHRDEDDAESDERSEHEEDEREVEADFGDEPTDRLEYIGDAAPRPSSGGAPESVERAREVMTNLLFATTQPLSVRRLSQLMGGLTYECVRSLVGDVARMIPAVGLQVRAVAGGYQLATNEASAEWVWKLSRRKPEAPLSPAALETLAIVAYKQPVTKSEVDVIRGVESGAVIRHLVDLELLQVAGRREVPGRPLIYRTSRRFLKMFGLARIADLPPIQELKKLYREKEQKRAEEEAKANAERRRADRDEALERLQEEAKAASELPPPPEVREETSDGESEDEEEGFAAGAEADDFVDDDNVDDDNHSRTAWMGVGEGPSAEDDPSDDAPGEDDEGDDDEGDERP